MPLNGELRTLIASYARTIGCSERSAIRDLLTEIALLCEDRGIDFDALVDAAAEVAAEERR